MTFTPSPPTDQTQDKPRRRRRWLIVVLVLVLVMGVAWWEWPRGDARFVGRWELYPNGAETFVLRSNETADIIHAGANGSFASKEMVWGVSGGCLVFGARSKLEVDFLRLIDPAYRAVIGGGPHGVQSVLPIVSVTSDELRVLHPLGQTLTYRRIPE